MLVLHYIINSSCTFATLRLQCWKLDEKKKMLKIGRLTTNISCIVSSPTKILLYTIIIIFVCVVCALRGLILISIGKLVCE